MISELINKNGCHASPGKIMIDPAIHQGRAGQIDLVIGIFLFLLDLHEFIEEFIEINSSLDEVCIKEKGLLVP